MKHTITMPEAMSEYVSGQIKDGMYGNVSEYFRDLVRRDQERKQAKLEELREMIKASEASGASGMSMMDIREEARKEAGLCN